MSVEVRRSPAKVSWWVVVNGTFISAFDTKWQANSYADNIRRQYA